MSWFARSAEKHPERFFMFFKDDPITTILDGLVAVLELDDDETWRRDAADAFIVAGKAIRHWPRDARGAAPLGSAARYRCPAGPTAAQAVRPPAGVNSSSGSAISRASLRFEATIPSCDPSAMALVAAAGRGQKRPPERLSHMARHQH